MVVSVPHCQSLTGDVRVTWIDFACLGDVLDGVAKTDSSTQADSVIESTRRTRRQ